MSKVRHLWLLLSVIVLISVSNAGESILVQSTTSTANSGFYDYLLPIFENDTGLKVNVVAVGTGQAIRNARNCDGDVLLVHAKQAEEKFVLEGFGVARHDVMYNDFVVVGPPDDPANIRSIENVSVALKQIALNRVFFASRGDDSGTHKKEIELWKAAGIDPTVSSGSWYRETGSGMGATLTATVGMNAYTMTDRATWISFKNKAEHEILLAGDSTLFNQYGVMVVNPVTCPSVNFTNAQRFVNWLLSDVGQTEIARYQVENQQLFFPNAKVSQ